MKLEDYKLQQGYLVPVEVINKSNNKLPAYETAGAAGLDVKASVEGTIAPGCHSIVKTGLYVAIPEGYEIQVRARSGLAYKHMVTVLNSPGTIDSDYRGEIGVILINHGHKDFTYEVGDRIAQLVLAKVERIHWTTVDELTETARGEGGYGSTNK
jgi:dUTP pyrophosphatase